MQIFSKEKNGFTLVELLLVTAIIGLLASIGLTILARYKDKARDAAIQIELTEVRNAAGMLYIEDPVTGFRNVCDGSTLSDTGSLGLIEDSIERNGGRITCLDSDTAYAVISTLNTKDCWCIDSAGTSKEITLVGGETCGDKLTDTVCP